MAEPLDKQVLIIDDDVDFTNLARVLIQPLVKIVQIENNPVAGLEAAKKGKFDLILCDVAMPGLNGFELRRRMTTDPTLADVPFIFISAHAGLDAQLSGLRMGATGYLTKPLRPDTLVAHVIHHLNRRPTLGGVPAVRGGNQNAGTPGQFGGRLDVIPMTDLLQLLEASASTGLLSVHGRAVTGELIFKRGRLLGARTNNRSGEDAALRLMWLKEGKFEFERAEVPDMPEGEGWLVRRLLLDAAWLHDELERLGANAPGVGDSITIVDRDASSDCFPDNADWQQIIAEGTSSLRIEELAMRLGISTYRARAVLGEAAEKGWVRVSPG